MKSYRIDTAAIVFPILLGTLLLVVTWWIGWLGLLWLVAFFYYAAYFEAVRQVTTDDQELSTSMGIFPFFPRWRRCAKWTDVVEVRKFQNPAFVEADSLLIGARSSKGKQHLLIPIAVLANRREFLKEFVKSLPPQVQMAPDILTWASSVGTTPRWQLGIALVVLLCLAAAVWFSSSR